MDSKVDCSSSHFILKDRFCGEIDNKQDSCNLQILLCKQLGGYLYE